MANPEQNYRVGGGQVREPSRSVLFYIGACALFGAAALGFSYLQRSKSDSGLDNRVESFISRIIPFGAVTER